MFVMVIIQPTDMYLDVVHCHRKAVRLYLTLSGPDLLEPVSGYRRYMLPPD